MSWSFDIQSTVGALELSLKYQGPCRPVLLIGPNGAGKSTLIKMLLGEMHPRQGSLEVNQHVLFSSEENVWLPIEKRQVGYVPQYSALFPHLSVKENIEFSRRFQSFKHEHSSEIVELLGIEHLYQRTIQNLSGGERRLVALARALAPKPKLLLLDEPFAGVDHATKYRLGQALGEILKNTPALIVSHEASDLQAFGDAMIVMEQGRFLQQGSLAQLAQSSAFKDFCEKMGPEYYWLLSMLKQTPSIK